MSNDAHDVEWRCGCGHTSPDYAERCIGCGQPRHEETPDEPRYGSALVEKQWRRWIAQVQALVSRRLTDAELAQAGKYFEIKYCPTYVAHVILYPTAGEESAAADPSPSNYGHW